MNTKICTSIEQSKKLIELGLDVKTADMMYSPPIRTHFENYGDADNEYEQPGYMVINVRCNIIKDNVLDKPISLSSDDIPSWSLSALLQLMPKDEQIEWSLSYGGWQIDSIKYVEKFFMTYEIEDLSIFHTVSDIEPLDSAFEMICWLLKNNKI